MLFRSAQARERENRIKQTEKEAEETEKGEKGLQREESRGQAVSITVGSGGVYGRGIKCVSVFVSVCV